MPLSMHRITDSGSYLMSVASSSSLQSLMLEAPYLFESLVAVLVSCFSICLTMLIV